MTSTDDEIKGQPTTKANLCACTMRSGMVTDATGRWVCADDRKPRWEV